MNAFARPNQFPALALFRACVEESWKPNERCRHRSTIRERHDQLVRIARPDLGTEVSASVPDTRRGRPQRTRGFKDDDETFRNNSVLALASRLARAVLVGKRPTNPGRNHAARGPYHVAFAVRIRLLLH